MEVLHEVLNHVDLQTLSRFARTSHRGRAAAKSLPAFRRLSTSAGNVFKTLSRTKVIALHSISKLDAVLQSDRCVSCGQHSAFLFILSAERCCSNCQGKIFSLLLIPLDVARQSLWFNKRLVSMLPKMRSIPQSYFIGIVARSQSCSQTGGLLKRFDKQPKSGTSA